MTEGYIIRADYSFIYLFIYLLPRTPQQLTPSVYCGTVYVCLMCIFLPM